jgi:hypothetical protein
MKKIILFASLVLCSATLSANIIIGGPLPQQVTLDGTAVFQVVTNLALTNQLHFQWYKNSQANPIPNATSDVLTIKKVQGTNVGNYFVGVRQGTNPLVEYSGFAQLSILVMNGGGYSGMEATHFDVRRDVALSFKLKTNGVFSGKITTQTNTYGFSGKFNYYNVTNKVTRKFGQPDLWLRMSYNPAGFLGAPIYCFITDTNDLHFAEGLQAVPDMRTNDLPFTGVLGAHTVTVAPFGQAYFTGGINSNGTVKLSGAFNPPILELTKLIPVSFASRERMDGSFLTYCRYKYFLPSIPFPIYGYFLGTNTLRVGPIPQVSTLYIRDQSVDQVTTFRGSAYTPPIPGNPVIPPPVSGFANFGALVYQFSGNQFNDGGILSANNIFTFQNSLTNGLKASIKPSNGLTKGSYKTSTGEVVTFSGVVLINDFQNYFMSFRQTNGYPGYVQFFKAFGF